MKRRAPDSCTGAGSWAHARGVYETADALLRRRMRARLEAHLRRQQAALAVRHHRLQEVHRPKAEFVAPPPPPG